MLDLIFGLNSTLRLRLVCEKAFPENIPFSGNAIFRKGKCIQVFGCLRIRFYRKSIPVFSLYKHFSENDFRFTENQFPCLVQSNILWKMEFVFYGKSILMFGLRIILRKITISSTCIT